MLLIRWLLIAIIWVYLPKYSTTDFGLPNGFLTNITQDFFHKSCRIYWYWIGNFALSLPQYLALKTFNNALTGNKNLPSLCYFSIFRFYCCLAGRHTTARNNAMQVRMKAQPFAVLTALFTHYFLLRIRK